MTLLSLLLPAGAVVLLVLVSRAAPRPLHPRIATIVLVLLSALAALSFVGAVALLAIGFVTQFSPLDGVCRAVTSTHDRIPAWLGVPSVATLVFIGFSVQRTRRRLRWRSGGHAAGDDLEVIPIPEPIAYSVPGRPGHIVVSVGMLRALPAAERRVLLAHERSHLERGHHRYLRVVELAAAAVPILSSLKHHVRHATERWADEDAAEHVGDRRLVATALARATVAGTDYTRAGAMGLVGGSVPARVEAMLAEPAARSALWMASLTSILGLATAFATSTVQLHHLLAFTNHVCPV